MKFIYIIIVITIVVNKISTSSYDECPFYRKAFETAGLGKIYDFVVETDNKYHNKSILTSIKESGQMFYKEIVTQRDTNLDILQRDGLYGYFKYSLVLSIPEYISQKLKNLRRETFGHKKTVEGPEIPSVTKENSQNYNNNYIIKSFDSLIEFIDKSIGYTSKNIL